MPYKIQALSPEIVRTLPTYTVYCTQSIQYSDTDQLGGDKLFRILNTLRSVLYIGAGARGRGM